MQSNAVHALKFVFAVFLLPVLIAATNAFYDQIESLSADYFKGFILGFFVYIGVHFFIGEPKWLYHFGHRIVSEVFAFLRPLVKVAPLVIPIYTILLLIIFYFNALILKEEPGWGYVYMFFVSFTFLMHLVFTAKHLRQGDDNAAKPDYFFSISWIYFINVFLMSLFMDIVLAKFSFTKCFEATVAGTQAIYNVVFSQLFAA